MRYIVFIFVLTMFSAVVPAQPDNGYEVFVPQFKKGSMYVVKTTEGTTYTGFVTNETKDFVTLENRKAGRTYELRKSEIVSSRIFGDKKVHENLLGENYHAGIYLLSASSILYDKPSVSINYQWFLFDNTTISLGTNWDLTINSILLYPSSVGLKCAYEIGDDTYVGANVFAVGNITDEVLPYFFLGYGGLARITRGNSNNNFSVSGGVLGINSELINRGGGEPFLNLPFAGFAYANRFSERWGVCLEAFYFPLTQSGFGGGGFKFMPDRETSWTFGCFAYMSLVNNSLVFGKKAVPIPFIAYSRNLFRN